MTNNTAIPNDPSAGQDRFGTWCLSAALTYLFIIGTIIGIGFLLMTTGCSSTKTRSGISAPKDMKPVAQGWVNTYKANLQANGHPVQSVSKLTVEDVPATRSSGKYPVFVFEGREVGGLYRGSCGSSGVIQQPRMADGRYSEELLGHEVGHHMDQHSLCKSGHPDYMREAGAPSWPTFNPWASDADPNARDVREYLVGEYRIFEILPAGQAGAAAFLELDQADRLFQAMSGQVVNSTTINP